MTAILPRAVTRAFIAFSTVLAPASAVAQSDLDTFTSRAERILSDFREDTIPSPGGSGKFPYGSVIATLAENPDDAAAINFLVNSGYGGEIFFNSIQQVRALYMVKDRLDAAQLDTILAQASDPANDWNNNGTENHRKMTWSSGYLLAQAFPDAQWRYGSETVSSTQLMANLKNRFIFVGQNEYDYGYSEFLSPNYQIYHLAPMLNLYDFAEDPEVQAIAEAFLHFHFATMALGSFEEIILPPWSRFAHLQNLTLEGASAQLLLWLYWNQGSLATSREIDPTLPLAFFALSDWRPPQVLNDIAQRSVQFPYKLQTQQTHFGWGTPRYVMRTTYQAEDYAVSSAAVRHLSGAFQLDDAQFGIAWSGGADVRQIHAFHPYWRSANPTNEDWLRPTSPFMQTAHHENSAIMLFDIPAEDPWAGIGQWASSRSDMIPLGQLRFPSFMNYTASGNWIFLNDGGIFIGIHVLKEGWRRDRRALPGFNVIESRGTDGQRWQTGFIFEVGTSAEFADFQAFQDAILQTQISVDWDAGSASYTDTDGDTIEIVYNTAINSGPDGTVPAVTINAQAVAFDASWPNLSSPWTRIDNRVLQIDVNASESLTIDWSNSIPVIDILPTEVEDNLWADFEFDPSGYVNTGGFLGWIYPDGDHAFVVDLNRYVFLPEDAVGEGGAWLFAPRPAQ